MRAAGGNLHEENNGGRRGRGVSSLHEADERLEEESQCSQHAHRHKNPEEDPVDDHGHVLPVVLHLQGAQGGGFLARERWGGQAWELGGEHAKLSEGEATGSNAQSGRFITSALAAARTATFTSRQCVAAAAQRLRGNCVSARLCLYVRKKLLKRAVVH